MTSNYKLEVVIRLQMRMCGEKLANYAKS